MPATLPTTPDTIVLTEDPTWIEVQSDQMTGPAPYTPDQDNLVAYLEFWDSVLDAKIVGLNAPYSTEDKRARFNLRSLFNLSWDLPSEASLDNDLLLIQYGICSNSFLKYKLKYADKYGSPSVPEALVTSSDFYAVKGGRSKGSNTFSPMSGAGQILHKYRGRNGAIFNKKVLTDSPEWIYFFVAAPTSAMFDVQFFYTDGTNETMEVTDSEMVLTPYSVYWCYCGHDQLNLGALSDDLKTLYKYTLTLRTDEVIPDIIDTITFELDLDYIDHSSFLLMSNGLGGLETVRLKGKAQDSTQSKKQLTDLAEWQDFDLESGSMSHVGNLANKSRKVSTGFHSSDYIDHLAQLICGDVWLINLDKARFEKWMITTSTIVRSDDDSTLYSFEITMRPGWWDPNTNNW